MFKSLAVALSIALLAGGCASSSPKPKGGSVVNVVEPACGNSDIVIKEVRGKRRKDGFMVVQVRGENTSGEYRRLEYKILWFDKNGFQIDTILSNWTVVPAYANQPFSIRTVSPSPKARKFRIYIRNEKEVVCDKQEDGV